MEDGIHGVIEFPSAVPAVRQPACGDGTRAVLLLAADFGAYDAEQSLEELAALAEAGGMRAAGEVLQKRGAADPATVLGAGRLAEAKLLAHNLGAEAAVFDGELSGSQLRNLEQALGIPVLDRTMLILQIFKSRAHTAAGKLQTELATLEYRLPRLAGHGASLSRQGGGGGGGGGARRGGGEQKLEFDRRAVRARIAALRRRLAALNERRGRTKASRAKTGVPTVALVGYTNVGKSSLVNALAQSDIPVQDALFATLDPTARRLRLPDGQSVVLTDTVGFVSRLPHHLVEAFKSTLEVAAQADLLLLVCDAAAADSARQLAVAEAVLAGIGAGAGTPRVTVYNKCDLVPGFVPFAPGAVAVSARTGEGLASLQGAIAAALAARMRRVTVLLPYARLSLADVLRSHGSVLREEFRPEGVYYEALVESAKSHMLQPYLFTD